MFGFFETESQVVMLCSFDLQPCVFLTIRHFSIHTLLREIVEDKADTSSEVEQEVGVVTTFGFSVWST